MKGIKSNSRGYIGQSSAGFQKQKRIDDRSYDNTMASLLESKNNLPPAARKRQPPSGGLPSGAKNRVPSHNVGNSHQRMNGRTEPNNRQNSVQPLMKKKNGELV